MKTNKKFMLAAAVVLGASSLSNAAILQHPRMQMLDHAFNKAPSMLDEIVRMKKIVSRIQGEVTAFKGRHSDQTRGGAQEEEFVAATCKELIEPNQEFLGYIYDYQALIESVVKESLSPLSQDTIDPKDAFILYRFFSVEKDAVDAYFYDSVQGVEDLEQVLDEFSHLTGDLLESFSASTKRNYMQWKREQKA